MGFPTPEEAARGDIAAEEVRVVAVITRGDAAVVAQITNASSYPDAYEIDTAHVYRGEDGWSSGMSSNGDLAFIPTSDSVGTLVFWREAPAGTAAGRFVAADQEATFAVENGFVVAVFDEVSSELWPDYPRLTEWLA